MFLGSNPTWHCPDFTCNFPQTVFMRPIETDQHTESLVFKSTSNPWHRTDITTVGVCTESLDCNPLLASKLPTGLMESEAEKIGVFCIFRFQSNAITGFQNGLFSGSSLTSMNFQANDLQSDLIPWDTFNRLSTLQHIYLNNNE